MRRGIRTFEKASTRWHDISLGLGRRLKMILKSLMTTNVLSSFVKRKMNEGNFVDDICQFDMVAMCLEA